MSNTSVALCILNRNDVEGARVVVPQVDRSKFDEVFVIDGGSTDGSIDFFKEQGLEVVVQNTGGRGGAMRTALDRTKCNHIVFYSTDGEEDPNDLPRFRELFNQGYELVIASRLMKGGFHKAMEKLKWIHRMWYLRFFTWLVNITFGAKLADCWNGYRGGRVSSLKEIHTDAQGYLIEAQQTIRFLKAGKKVGEFPTKEGQRIGGQSGNPIFKSGYQHIILLLRERFNSTPALK